jgi:hypothetical protein
MCREIRHSGIKLAGSGVLSKRSFQRILKRYAELERRCAEVFQEEQAVLQYLRFWFRFKETIEMVGELNEALEELTLPGGVQPGDRPYRELLTRVFEEKSRSYATAYTRWRDYLSSLADRAVESMPSSRETLIGEHIKNRVAEIRSRVCPPWPPEARNYIEYVLNSALTHKALLVIRPVFGLGEERKTMREVAADLGISVPTARGRYNLALKALERCEYARELRRLVSPVPLKIMVPGSDPRLPVMCQSVDLLELSVRTGNCLYNANLRYIGEVVQRKDSDLLLKIKNFGRKSLKELSAKLAEHGNREGIPLSLGTVFDPEFVIKLDQELSKLSRC